MIKTWGRTEETHEKEKHEEKTHEEIARRQKGNGWLN